MTDSAEVLRIANETGLPIQFGSDLGAHVFAITWKDGEVTTTPTHGPDDPRTKAHARAIFEENPGTIATLAHCSRT